MWARYLTAAVLGLPLTVAVLGLVALAWPGDPAITALPWMMMTFPVWITAMTLAFTFRSQRRAWWWLVSVTLASFALLYGLKALHLIGVQA